MSPAPSSVGLANSMPFRIPGFSTTTPSMASCFFAFSRSVEFKAQEICGKLTLRAYLLDLCGLLHCRMHHHLARPLSHQYHRRRWPNTAQHSHSRERDKQLLQDVRPRRMRHNILLLYLIHDHERVHLLHQPPSGIPPLAALLKPNLFSHRPVLFSPGRLSG